MSFSPGKLFPLSIPLLVAALGTATTIGGCASEDQPLCVQASNVIAECNISVETDPYAPEGACDAAAVADSAEGIVNLYDDVGCAGIATLADKSDGCFLCADHDVSELKPFETDGCSAGPDGTATRPVLWLECCVEHDLAYYVGGSEAMRKTADKELRACVTDKCGRSVAEFMYNVVSVGGSPALFTSWRWGYGWDYDPLNGYRMLPEDQLTAAMANVDAYRADPVSPRPFLDPADAKKPDSSLICD